MNHHRRSVLKLLGLAPLAPGLFREAVAWRTPLTRSMMVGDPLSMLPEWVKSGWVTLKPGWTVKTAQMAIAERYKAEYKPRNDQQVRL